MKEMVGGCCVCSDERGWPENPLVYCDGSNCTVAVHQACYGIVTVPTGPWYCRKCESQERSARVRCELCPSRDGALKKTDNQGWAHVVCALYIPEVRFGNVTTMEPIILQLIPPERYSKTCYICQEIGKGSKAHVGACMQCNKSGCKQQFHVTCAQGLGLLCEEAGNYLDNVKYCGYCQHHYSKLKKGGNVKTIPPYKPVTNETGSDPPSSPEKEIESATTSSSTTNQTITASGSSSSSIKSTVQSSNIINSQSMPKQRKSSGNSKLSMTNATVTLSVMNPLVQTININTSGGSSGISTGGNNISSGNNCNTNTNVNSNTNNISMSSSKNSSSNSSSKDKDSKHSKNTKVTAASRSSHDKDSSSIQSSSNREKSSKSSKGGGASSGGSSSSNSGGSGNNNKDNIGVIVTDPLSMTGVSSIASTTIVSNIKDINALTKDSLGQKFTTSNFTETIVVNSESVFGSESAASGSGKNQLSSGNGANNSGTSSTITVAKKRKVDSGKSSANSSTEDINKDLIKDVSVTLVPLPMDRTETTDEKLSKKQKTDNSSSTTVHSGTSNEPNMQNASPNVPSSQSQQSTNSSGSSSSSVNKIVQQNSSIQLPLVKLSSNDIRLQQQMSSTSSNSYSQNVNSSAVASSSSINNSNNNCNTPSLVVSVPLPTTTIPGLNLPPSTSSSHLSQIQINNFQNIGGNNNSNSCSSNIGSNIITQQHRSNELLNTSAQRSSPVINVQQQQTHHIQSHSHSSSVSVLQTQQHIMMGRQSPLIISANSSTISTNQPMLSPTITITTGSQSTLSISTMPITQTIGGIGDLSSSSSSSLSSASATAITPTTSSMPSITATAAPTSSTSIASISVVRSASPTVHTIGGVASRNISPMTSGGIKITYDKPGNNSRVAQLQESESSTSIAGRRSRSQSNDSSNKTRNSKKRTGGTSSSPSQNIIANTIINDMHSIVASNANNKESQINNSNNNGSSSGSNNGSIITTTQTSTTTTTTTITTNITNKSSSKNKKSRTTSNDETPPHPSTCRTPDNPYSNSVTATINVPTTTSSSSTSSFGGLKFSYEAQSGTVPAAATASLSATASTTATVTPSVTPQPTIKDSPPSSPGSESGSRKRKSGDTKDFKIFQNGVHATHMLGNQINPSSSVAQKLSDQLHMEMEAHSVYTSSSMDSGTQLIGIPFPGKNQTQRNSATQSSQGTQSLTSMLGGNGQPTAAGNTPQSLETLLERQWEQGSQFLMEQAQHFDIASLLSCLHQLKSENVRLEEHVTNLVARRDHLLAVNARLAIPLSQPVQQNSFNNMHMNGPTEPSINTSARMSRGLNTIPQSNYAQQQPIENGIDFRQSQTNQSSGSNNNSSTAIRQSSSSLSYPSGQQSHSSGGSSRQQQSSSSSSVSNNPEQSRRAAGSASSNRDSSGGNYSSHHQSQNVYSSSHQQGSNRRDDSQVKPS